MSASLSDHVHHSVMVGATLKGLLLTLRALQAPNPVSVLT